ncbi:MAG: Gfo/Idh/MocA family oxidoreductase, partial [Thiobacillaceae bacterium]|nr:Gfo/Idh/MocA family oxidoreductase [Thiobacillaceae bacterium]
MGELRAGVIGVGYLGRFHVLKWAALDGARLVGVADSDPARAQTVAAETGCTAYDDHRALLRTVDLVSVAVPTEHHHRIVCDCLEAGVHVLVEKPITPTVAQADDLIERAQRRGLKLQVGHLERFNPAWQSALPQIDRPRFIEAHRLAPFKPRGTDVSVVLDLMIHDLDLILSLSEAAVTEVRASGTAVLTEGIDIGNARIEFANGCVANLTASRVSTGTLRKMRLFLRDRYLAVDFGARTVGLARRGTDAQQPIVMDALPVPAGDALEAEIAAFAAAVRTDTPVPVSGEDGRRSLALA